MIEPPHEKPLLSPTLTLRKSRVIHGQCVCVASIPLTIFSIDRLPELHVVSVLGISLLRVSNSGAGPVVVTGAAVVDAGGAAVVDAGGAAVDDAGGAAVVDAGGAAVVDAGGAAVVDAGGAAVVDAGGAAVVVSGAPGQLKPATSLSVTMFCSFLVFQPQTRLFHRGQAQTEVIPPKLDPLAVIFSPLAHL